MNFKKVFLRKVEREGGGCGGKQLRGSWTQPTIRILYAISIIHQSFFVKGKFDGKVSKPPVSAFVPTSSRTRLQWSGNDPSASRRYAVNAKWNGIIPPTVYVTESGSVTSCVR